MKNMLTAELFFSSYVCSILSYTNIRLAYERIACEGQTYFRSSLLSLRKEGREATTGNTSALRRLTKGWHRVANSKDKKA